MISDKYYQSIYPLQAQELISKLQTFPYFRLAALSVLDPYFASHSQLTTSTVINTDILQASLEQHA